MHFDALTNPPKSNHGLNTTLFALECSDGVLIRTPEGRIPAEFREADIQVSGNGTSKMQSFAQLPAQDDDLWPQACLPLP